MSERPADIIIVGAGPAGSAAAIAARRAGARVVVLDRATFPRNKTCGDAISNRAYDLLGELTGSRAPLVGVPHARVDAGIAILPDANTIVRRFGEHPGYIVPRLVLDALLCTAARDAGAEVREGVAVRAIEIAGGRAVGVRTDDGAIAAPVVIAADGPGSVAWTALGRPYHRDRRLAVAMTLYLEGVRPGAWADANEHYFESDLRAGYGWIFPDVDGVANVGIYQRADRFHAHGRSLRTLYDAFAEHHRDRLDGARIVGRPRSWALPLATGPRLWTKQIDGLLLAGDAANFVDPLAGEGIWQALHSGMLAGAAAVEIAAGDRSTRAAGRYRRRCALDIELPSLVRLGVQEAMDVLVSTKLHERALVRAVLSRGYGDERLEVSKRLRV